jgi:hypothetical protein
MDLPDMRFLSGEWRLSAGGISIPPVSRGIERQEAIQRLWDRLLAQQQADPR